MTQPRQIEPLFQSDALQPLQELLSQIAAFEPIYRKLIRVQLVIDASVIQRELRWRVRGRKKADARSSMQEAIDAGTLILFAPTWLKCEIEEHAKDIAADTGATEELVIEEWRKLAEAIHFYSPTPVDIQESVECVDPDDLPYKLVRNELGAHGIYSSDAHFDAMGEPRINIKIFSCHCFLGIGEEQNLLVKDC